MKLGKIAGYVGAGLLTASCSLKKPAPERALEHASKYLKGYEVVVAEDYASKINTHEKMNYSNDIFYWDSLLSKNREKEFINLGKKHIQDSLNGIYNRKPIFIFPNKPGIKQNGLQIIDSIKKEVAKYYNGVEFLKLEKNAPKSEVVVIGSTSDNHVTHYYGEFAIKGAERKGFFDGLKAARDSLNKR